MTLEIFGWPAQHIDATWLPPTPPVYLVHARCSERCHVMRHMISEEHLDRIVHPDAIWKPLHEQIVGAFKRVHPEVV